MLSCFDLLVELFHFAIHVKLVVPRPFEQTVICGEVCENCTAIYTWKKKNNTKELIIHVHVRHMFASICLEYHSCNYYTLQWCYKGFYALLLKWCFITEMMFYYWNDVLILCIKDSINWIIEKWLKHVNKKNFPWFVMVYDFYTAQMFFYPIL